MTEDTTTPVEMAQPGMIIAYGGDVTDADTVQSLKSKGWLVCDGAAYNKTDHLLLAVSIGTSFGGVGGSTGTFNVPDLRGRFLRGTSYTSGLDPDAEVRIAINENGVVGNKVGSLQLSATALPETAFAFSTDGDHAHSVDNVPQDSNAYALIGSHYAIANSGGITSGSAGKHTHELGNWDSESRPVNVYVNFLICTGEVTSSATIPVLYGAVAAFGFGLATGEPAQPWLFCGGSSQSSTTYPNLEEAIGTTWGSGATGADFLLPDLEGVMIRGVSPTTNAITTFQTSATGLPRNSDFGAISAGDHRHSVKHVPGDSTSYYSISGSHYGWDQDVQDSKVAGAHTHSCGKSDGDGGDKETRPPNVYVDYGILGDVYTKSNGTDTPSINVGLVGDSLPVGAILAYAAPLNMDTLTNSNFLYCDGSSVSRTDYKDLFAVIGTNFGAGDGASTFNLPNLVGNFPRGVNGDASGDGYDPDAADRVCSPLAAGGNSGNKVGSWQDWATGAPVTTMTTSEEGEHKHDFPNIPTSKSSSAVAGSGQSIWNDDSTDCTENGAHTHSVTGGGDSESRPVNVSCYYVIKYL